MLEKTCVASCCHVKETLFFHPGSKIVFLFHKGYLIVPTLCVTGVWRLVADQHVVEIHPGEGGDRFGVIRQMSNEALIRGVSDVEHQPLFGRLFILRIQSCRGKRSQDELVHL